MNLSAAAMAWRAAQDLADGECVNLGIGLPERVADFIPPGREIIIHSENGLLGMGPAPTADLADSELINAGKKPVTLVAGGCFFHHADSFAMIRGGHIDVCIMGAFQVSEHGDLANWTTGTGVPAVGGAMDLAQGARQVFALMTHTMRDGGPKVVRTCHYPLTAARVVRRIYTDLAVIDVTPEGLVVTDLLEGLNLEELQARSEPQLRPAPGLRILRPPPGLVQTR